MGKDNLISSKLTKFNKIVYLVMVSLFLFLPLIDLRLLIITLISLAFIVLRVIPQKTIYYNDSEIFYYKNNKPVKVNFSEIENIESMSFLPGIYEINTKHKRKLFDRLMFIPSYIEIFRSFGFWKPDSIKKLEKLIEANKRNHLS